MNLNNHYNNFFKNYVNTHTLHAVKNKKQKHYEQINFFKEEVAVVQFEVFILRMLTSGDFLQSCSKGTATAHSVILLAPHS